jgi:hypothetical protein
MILDDEDINLFEFTVLDTDHVAFDCGYFAPITHMWNDVGEPTLNREEAKTIAFALPSDDPLCKHTLVDLDYLQKDEVETFH